MMRGLTVRNRPVVMIARRRWQSTITATTPTNIPPVISRRSWQAFRSKNPLKQESSSSSAKNTGKKSADETSSWPRNVILGAYVAAGVGIPYCIAWFLSNNASARSWVSPLLLSTVGLNLEQALRPHFGDKEEVPYPDRRELEIKKLSDELSFYERQQQAWIDEFAQESITVRMSAIDKSDGTNVSKKTCQLSGSTPMTISALKQEWLQQAGSDSLEGTRNTDTIQMAVDFPTSSSSSSTIMDKEDSPILMDDTTTTTNNNNMMNQTSELTITPQDLARSVYSSWYYQPPTAQQVSQRSKHTSQMDIQITKLEYDIFNLQSELSNVLSTRDMDDIRDELANAKAELRNLRWKRRLGMS